MAFRSAIRKIWGFPIGVRSTALLEECSSSDSLQRFSVFIDRASETTAMARRVQLQDTKRVIEVIKEDGAVILTGFSTATDIQTVNTDAASYIQDILQEQETRDLPPATVRVSRFFGRSETAREVWLQQPSLLEILQYFLRTESVSYNGTEKIVSDPILSAAATLDIGPGITAQELHRDDFIWHQTHGSLKAYERGRDVGMGLLVPGVKTTLENGATLFVPGSHLWDHERRPHKEEVAAAEMDTGEALLFLASTAHAGGANTTDGRRTVHGFFFCRAFIRPEENHFLWFKKAEVDTWSRSAQKQAGYVTGSPWIGNCEDKSPIDLFRASADVDCERLCTTVPSVLASDAAEEHCSTNGIPSTTSQNQDGDRTRFTFPHGNWFELVRVEWEARTLGIRHKPLNILEIGSFEGASTTWILDNMLSHSDSRLTAVDTFGGGMEHQVDNDDTLKTMYDLNSLEARFLANVVKCKHYSKLRVVKATSEDALGLLRSEKAHFDFIYIDASHVALDVLQDAVMCWRLLKVGGTMVFDDLTWKGYMQHFYNPRMAIKAFLECAAPELEYIVTESQAWVTRVENKVPATKNPDPDLFYKESGLDISQDQ